jgi:hypothetical protein
MGTKGQLFIFIYIFMYLFLPTYLCPSVYLSMRERNSSYRIDSCNCGGLVSPNADGGRLAVWRFRKNCSLSPKAVCWQNSCLSREVSLCSVKPFKQMIAVYSMRDDLLYSTSATLNVNLIQKKPHLHGNI